MIDEIFGYKFKDKNVLNNALRHSSYANENRTNGMQDNERLEFLGDAVLGFITAEYIFLNNPEMPEGQLTKIRASVVCESALASIANNINLSSKILVGKGEKQNNGHKRDSVLSDALEAVLAAIYIDGGLLQVRKVILENFTPLIKEATEKGYNRDCKTFLQEIIQRTPEEKLNYKIISEIGPDHEKIFTVSVNLNGKILGQGMGKSKKEAEQRAAEEALKLMNI